MRSLRGLMRASPEALGCTLRELSLDVLQMRSNTQISDQSSMSKGLGALGLEASVDLPWLEPSPAWFSRTLWPVAVESSHCCEEAAMALAQVQEGGGLTSQPWGGTGVERRRGKIIRNKK